MTNKQSVILKSDFTSQDKDLFLVRSAENISLRIKDPNARILFFPPN